MSATGSHIRAAETGRECTASACLALVDRALTRLENEQVAFAKARAEMREAIRLSGPAARITQPHRGSCLGAGIISKGVHNRERRPSPAALSLIREYHESGTMLRVDCAKRAQVSEPTVTKYARLMAEGKL